MREDEIGPLYCNIFQELKSRIVTISEVSIHLKSPTNEWQVRHNQFLFEGLYLQLRKVCELLSLGMLLVQSEDPEIGTEKLHKKYRADELINSLTRINPRSFPRPVSKGEWTNGTIENIQEFPAVFTSDELETLYFKCDGIMHVGSLKDLKSGKTKEINQDFVSEWVQRLLNGLAHHIVSLPSKQRVMLVSMQNPKNDLVTCTFASEAT